MALVAFACGDDDTAATDGSAVTTASTAAPAETTTTTAAPVTTSAPETTEAAPNPLVVAALEFEGRHSGEWNNTTFGSSGSIDLTIEVDEAAEVLIVTTDLGGFVFGGADPDPITYELDLSIGDPDVDVYEFVVDDGLFGGGTVTLQGTGLRFVAPAVAGVGGLEMIVEGELTATGMTGFYTITGLAEGTLEIVFGS